jgi:hypothetical protein
MTILWNKSEDGIWFGQWRSGDASNLYLVVERLPDGSGWDWAVWDPNRVRLLRHGLALTADDAVNAAEPAARGVG